MNSNCRSHLQKSTSVTSTHLQVDLIVCFDASASPVRNTQRIGRTGRHKDGRVVYILSEGKERDNYDKNMQARAPLPAPPPLSSNPSFTPPRSAIHTLLLPCVLCASTETI